MKSEVLVSTSCFFLLALSFTSQLAAAATEAFNTLKRNKLIEDANPAVSADEGTLCNVVLETLYELKTINLSTVSVRGTYCSLEMMHRLGDMQSKLKLQFSKQVSAQ